MLILGYLTHFICSCGIADISVQRDTEIDGNDISRYSINRPLDKINYVDRNILRIAVFSMLYEKDLHPSIVINEAVKLSQEMSTDVTYKFINGMLDNISKKEISR